MKSVLLMAAAMLVVSAGSVRAQTAQSWSPVAAQPEYIRAVNVPSVAGAGDRKTFEILDVYQDRHALGADAIDYNRARYEVDCRAGTSLMLSVSGFLTDGTLVASGQAPADARLAPVRDGSMSAETLEAVCGEKWMVVQYRTVEGFVTWAREGGIAEWNDPSW
ncbi:MAG: hypothetical protein REJ23_08735 [Brevundimonas sp.]|nr:hypothetical protein [Brevundimonas sp.]